MKWQLPWRTGALTGEASRYDRTKNKLAETCAFAITIKRSAIGSFDMCFCFTCPFESLFISFFKIHGLFFLYFSLFNTVYMNQMFNINFADGWIRTVDLWCMKQLLWQLNHILPQLNSLFISLVCIFVCSLFLVCHVVFSVEIVLLRSVAS